MNIDIGTVVLGKYKIIDKLGVGGMAVVYHAMDETLDRDVTFKVLKEEFISDNEFVKRFRAEAKAAAKLNHQNIVRIYDYGNDGDIYYIAMEYVDGCTLKEIIKNKAPLSNEETISVALQIAEGLMHAHNHNVIHRDIKPQNILVTKDGKHGNIKVTDFGIARAATSNTINAEAVGSVHYFSPEQARGMHTDARSDIYSLGIVMFEMITGRLPFVGDNIVEMAIKHSNDPIPDIKSFNTKASQSIIKIIDKCTRKLAAERYQNAEELINDLRLALTDPSGKFVKENDINDGKTVVATPEELQEIRNKTRDASELIVGDDISGDDISDDDYDETEEEFENRKNERKVIIGSVALALAIIAVLTFGIYYVYSNVINPTVVVPRFIDLDIETAEQLAENKKLYLTKENINDNKVEAGTVMAQSIDEGIRVARNSRITLTVSLGSEKVPMENILDKTEEEAVAILEAKNIHIDEIKYENNERIPVGTVIRQTPPAGTEIGKDDKVVFYISLGAAEENIPVPDILGMTKEQATQALQNFTVKFLEESYSDKYPVGQVAFQGVPAGTMVPYGFTVTATISKGPDPALKLTEEATTETTTEYQAAPIEPVKRAVSIPVIPSFVGNPPTKTVVIDVDTGEEVIKDEQGRIPNGVTTRLQVVEDKEYLEKNYLVKAVAIDAENTRILYEKYVSGKEFPFSINDQIDKDTNYKIYVDNEVILEREEKY
ncbi:MAG: Stk1 family PASTA domain-containing Ser/Thr kinase [Firmicutes bacterium]|nr:Stk1 family PASTA domain-containing Ser/Thr kinase [Bacillota bacterium]